MIPSSVCPLWQPEQAADAAQDSRSYTTPGGTIPATKLTILLHIGEVKMAAFAIGGVADPRCRGPAQVPEQRRAHPLSSSGGFPHASQAGAMSRADLCRLPHLGGPGTYRAPRRRRAIDGDDPLLHPTRALHGREQIEACTECRDPKTGRPIGVEGESNSPPSFQQGESSG